MPLYQVIDKATLELIDKLLEAGVLQLLLIAPIVMGIVLIIFSLLNYRMQRQRQKYEEAQRTQELQADDKLMNRMIDIADKANTNNDQANQNTAALTTAINVLTDTQRETRAIHQMNRESILAQQEAVNVLVINVQRLGQQHLTWGKLIDENMEGLRGDLQQLTTEIKHLQKLADDPLLQTHIESVLKAITSDILSKMDAILSRLPKDPPPTPPGNEAQPVTPRKPTDADGAKDATVDLALVPPERKEDAA